MSHSMEQSDGRGGTPTMTRRRFLAAGSAAAGLAALGSSVGRLVEAAAAIEPSTAGGFGRSSTWSSSCRRTARSTTTSAPCPACAGFSDRPVLTEHGRTASGTRSSTSSDTSRASAWTRPATSSPSTSLSDPPDGERPDDQRHHPRLGPPAPELERRRHGRVRLDPHRAATTGRERPVTMGYFTRDDLAFYYALADAFRICDGYHCSVLGPTDPNRVMSISATIDPAGSPGARSSRPTRRPADELRDLHLGDDARSGS